MEGDLPYVGELLRVKDEELPWEGAIEKLLHGFGLSMLVPEAHYKQVSQFVNTVNLKGKLVYFKVPYEIHRSRYFIFLDDSLVNKVEIRPDTEFYDWIRNELSEKFNYICCETMEKFQREPFAITKEGQIKVKYRHEKDDRRSIHDRRSYILGWSNSGKLDVIRKEAEIIEKQMEKMDKEIKSIEGKQEFLFNEEIL